MTIDLTDKEKELLREILESYLSDLREEIVKTEDHKWKPPLHEKEEIIKKLIERLS